MLLVTVMTNFTADCVNIKGTYLQSGLMTRHLYNRTRKEWKGHFGTRWKISKPPYGIREDGHQWESTREVWFLWKVHLGMAKKVSHFHLQRGQNNFVLLMIVKQTDDIFLTESRSKVSDLHEKIDFPFKTRKSNWIAHLLQWVPYNAKLAVSNLAWNNWHPPYYLATSTVEVWCRRMRKYS